jgi:dCMP deaminase
MSNRTPWSRYFMDLARQVATRGTCPRKQVGAVIVRDHHLLATGYNGSIGGHAHCTDVGCMMENDHCVRTVHAECNALAQAARHGTAVLGATLYTTAAPCWNCYKLARNAGIDRVVYDEPYNLDPRVDSIHLVHIAALDVQAS